MNQVDAATRASLTAEDIDDEMLNMEDHDDRNNMNFNNEAKRDRKKNIKVVNALTRITEAPNELADYIELLVSTQSQPHGKSSGSQSSATSNQFIRKVSRILTQDGMVTVSGSQLEQAVSEAVHYIVNPNHNYINRMNNGDGSEWQNRKNDSANHRKRKSFDNNPFTQRNNYGNNQIPPSSNISRHDYNDYYSSRLHNQRGSLAQHPNFGQNPRSRPPPPPPPPPPPQRITTQRSISPQDANSRRRHQPQKSYLHQHNRHQNHHSYNQGNHSLPKMDRGRNLDHNQGHNRQGHGNDSHTTFQRNNNKLQPPPVLSHPSASRKSHPHSHPPSHHHRNFDENSDKSRIIHLTNIPPNVTHNQLLHYFTRKMNVNVINLDLKIETINHNRNNHKPDIQNHKVAYVELATHDQAMFIYHSPETVLGNRFIGIQIYHKQTHRRNKNNSSNNPQRINVQQPQKQQNIQNQSLKHSNETSENKRLVHNSSVLSHHSYHHEKKSEDNTYDQHQQSNKLQSKDYELIETYKKQQTLLHKKESILEKQLIAHKKMFSLLKDSQMQPEITQTTGDGEENSTNKNIIGKLVNSSLESKVKQVNSSGTTNPKQQEKLKEILKLQKTLNQVKKDRLESLSKMNELQKKISSLQNSLSHHHNHRYRSSDITSKSKSRRNYKLDKRTTILNISNLPADTPRDAIMDHFTPFGKVTNVEMKENNSAEITFSNRGCAERAKENGFLFNDSAIIIEWCNKVNGLDSSDHIIDDSNELSEAQQNTSDEFISMTQEDDIIEQNDIHRENTKTSTSNDIVNDEDDYINDDEARWRIK